MEYWNQGGFGVIYLKSSILPIQLEYWNLTDKVEVEKAVIFYRYNWSIETKKRLKQEKSIDWFYRYNWSIETSLTLLAAEKVKENSTDTIGVLKRFFGTLEKVPEFDSTDTIGVLKLPVS